MNETDSAMEPCRENIAVGVNRLDELGLRETEFADARQRELLLIFLQRPLRIATSSSTDGSHGDRDDTSHTERSTSFFGFLHFRLLGVGEGEEETATSCRLKVGT